MSMIFPFKDRAARVSRRSVIAGLATMPVAGCLGAGPRAGLTAQLSGQTLSDEPVLHIVTTRRLVAGGRQSPFFDSSRSPRMAYAKAHLKAPDRSTLGRLSALVKSDFSVQQVEYHPGEASQMLAESLRGRDSLMFVHGYNQTFEAAALDAALLSEGIGFKGNTALFSWPSKGGLLDYGYDRESALIARDHLGEALAAVLTDQFASRCHLVAHSMGTLVTLEALRSYRDQHGDKGLDRLGALVLASPDVDLDVFKAHLSRLGPLRQKMTIITATNDRALDLSRRLAGGDRVGALPADAFEGLGVKVVDATDFASGLVRHDAFVANADVRAVIQRAVERA